MIPFLLIYFSGTCIFTFRGKYADVVELADTPDLGSGGVKPVGVRVPPSAPKNNQTVRGPRLESLARELPLGSFFIICIQAR